jgi:hypothetical protein
MPLRNQNETTPFYAKRIYRVLSGAFGALLIGTGLYALLFTGPMTPLSLAGGIGFVVFGGNMVASAYAAKVNRPGFLGGSNL